jgi:hypothetical protein
MPRKVLIATAPKSHQDEAIQVEVTLPVRRRRVGCHAEAAREAKAPPPVALSVPPFAFAYVYDPVILAWIPTKDS